MNIYVNNIVLSKTNIKKKFFRKNNCKSEMVKIVIYISNKYIYTSISYIFVYITKNIFCFIYFCKT